MDRRRSRHHTSVSVRPSPRSLPGQYSPVPGQYLECYSKTDPVESIEFEYGDRGGAEDGFRRARLYPVASIFQFFSWVMQRSTAARTPDRYWPRFGRAGKSRRCAATRPGTQAGHPQNRSPPRTVTADRGYGGAVVEEDLPCTTSGPHRGDPAQRQTRLAQHAHEHRQAFRRTLKWRSK